MQGGARHGPHRQAAAVRFRGWSEPVRPAAPYVTVNSPSSRTALHTSRLHSAGPWYIDGRYRGPPVDVPTAWLLW